MNKKIIIIVVVALLAAGGAYKTVLAKPAKGPCLYVIKVAAENPPRSLPSRDAVFVKNRFRAHLGFPAG